MTWIVEAIRCVKFYSIKESIRESEIVTFSRDDGSEDADGDGGDVEGR